MFKQASQPNAVFFGHSSKSLPALNGQTYNLHTAIDV